MARVGGSEKKEYDIFFKQAVSGLARGSGVAFSGVPVGEVKTIALMPDTPEFVRVRISVNEEVPILHGTTASIEGIGLTGGSEEHPSELQSLMRISSAVFCLQKNTPK